MAATEYPFYGTLFWSVAHRRRKQLHIHTQCGTPSRSHFELSVYHMQKNVPPEHAYAFHGFL